MRHPKDLSCSFLYRKTTPNNPPTKQFSERQQQPQQLFCKIAASRAHSSCKQTQKTHFAALPVCKSTSIFWWSSAGLWQPKVLQSCFVFLLVFKRMCRKTRLKSQQETPASTSLLPSPHFHQSWKVNVELFKVILIIESWLLNNIHQMTATWSLPRFLQEDIPTSRVPSSPENHQILCGPKAIGQEYKLWHVHSHTFKWTRFLEHQSVSISCTSVSKYPNTTLGTFDSCRQWLISQFSSSQEKTLLFLSHFLPKT